MRGMLSLILGKRVKANTTKPRANPQGSQADPRGYNDLQRIQPWK